MAKEYIERQRAIVDACNSLELYPSEYAELENALNRIPAADVVPVIYCKDCVYAHPLKESNTTICAVTGMGIVVIKISFAARAKERRMRMKKRYER